MHTNQLTTADMAGFMQTLAVNFGGKKDLEAKADLWYDKLRRYPLDVVQGVVNRLLLEEHQYFPQLGRAMKLARDMAPIVREGEASLSSQMRHWETDPWVGIEKFEDSLRCTSNPCPVCGSVIEFSSRGAVIVHDGQRHREAGIGYCDLGKAIWFSMPPADQLPPPPKPGAPQPLRALVPASGLVSP